MMVMTGGFIGPHPTYKKLKPPESLVDGCRVRVASPVGDAEEPPIKQERRNDNDAANRIGDIGDCVTVTPNELEAALEALESL